MPIVSGLDDPLAVLLADDLADVMWPDDHGADACRSGPTPMRPIAREVIGATRIGTDKTPHFPAAPRRRARAIAAGIAPRLSGLGKRGKPSLVGAADAGDHNLMRPRQTRGMMPKAMMMMMTRGHCWPRGKKKAGDQRDGRQRYGCAVGSHAAARISEE